MKRTIPVVLFLSALALAGCTATDAPQPPSTSTPAAEATPAPTPLVVDGLPSSCDALFTPALKKFVSPDGSLELNPAWKSGPGTVRTVENGYGSYDPTIAKVLSTDPGLVCDWAPPAGPSYRFLTTQVRHVDSATKQAVLAHMGKLGAACTPYMGGNWCVTNIPDGNGVYVGEAQFFRDDVWLASDWYDAGPEMYTTKMIKTLFG